MRTRRWLLLVTFCLSLPLTLPASGPTDWTPLTSLDAVAQNYVLLVLRIDQHQPGFNDYYYGPPEWKQRVAEEERIPTEELQREVRSLLLFVDSARGNPERLGWFRKQLVALDANLRQLQGEKLSIREQARLLFDLDVTPVTLEELEAARAELDRLLPPRRGGQGNSSLLDRLTAWREQFRVREDELDAAYRLALEVTRQHTRELLLLPANEEVDLHFVKNKSWGAYNWFQGQARSRIEINTDLPASASAIFDFAAHEAYPGHHTDLATREQRLYRERGYLEWCVSPLFTPMSTLAEAVAQVGTELVMREEDRLAWHRDVFFPALGIEGVEVKRWREIEKAEEALSRAREHVPFLLFDDGKSEEEIIAFLEKYALLSPERARKAVDFSRQWGAYTFNYTVGREILRRYLASGNARAKFVELLTTPVYPSLVEEWIREGREP